MYTVPPNPITGEDKIPMEEPVLYFHTREPVNASSEYT
jgi:hypothetical protein